jgi:hypothetical protein
MNNFTDPTPLGVDPFGYVDGAGEPNEFTVAALETGGTQVYLVELYPYKRGATALSGGVEATPLGVLAFGELETPVDPTAGIATVLYSDAGYVSPPQGVNGSVWFEGRVLQPLRLTRMLPLTPEAARRVVLEIAGIEIINADGALDTLLRECAIDGRRVIVKLGRRDYAYNQFTPVFSGRAVQWKGDLRRVVVSVRDEGYRLNIPLQGTLYSGAGGINGTSDLTGKPVPICFGKRRNIAPVPIDPTNLVLQFHSRTVAGVDAVYDKGAALSATTDYGSYAALTGAVIASGSYATCLALGLIRLGASPAGLVTADVRGDAQGSYIDTTMAIALRLLTDFAGVATADIDTVAFTSAAVTGTVGWYRSADPISAEQALSEIVGHCAAWWGATTDGQITVGRIALPDSNNVGLTLEAWDPIDVQIIDPPPGTVPPRFRQRVAYRENGNVQRADVAAGVTDARKQEIAEPYRVVTAINTDTQADFVLAQDPDVLGSLFDSSTDAQTLADLLIALFSVPRTCVAVDLDTLGHLGKVGQTISLTHPRINNGGTWYARCIGADVDARRRRVTLILWG